MLDSTTREQVRLSLVRYLSVNPTPYGLQAPALRQFLVAEGWQVTPAEVIAELTYLEDKGLITRIIKAISPENAAYRVTAAGRDQFAQSHGG